MKKIPSEIKALIVCSKNSGKIAPFITEQADAVQAAGVVMEYFCIEGKGWSGYLRNRRKMMRKIAEFQPDIIHAHYGLSGLLANTQRKIPVVTTYHGSDINQPTVYPYSKQNMYLSAHNIFVSKKNLKKAGLKKKYSLIPCGVTLSSFEAIDKVVAREQSGLSLNAKFVLFSGSFENKVKNPELAMAAVKLLNDVTLLELNGYTREEVTRLMYAVDACLMTSYTEGSPQFIKEAMVCGCPVVSVDVGDVAEVMDDLDGCYLADYKTEDVAEKLLQAMIFGKRTKGRKRIIDIGMDSETVAKKIIEVYNKTINDKRKKLFDRKV
ncbi:MAG: glycosyltransferase [Paludibacter sp.]|nr:glycosyltransferase [Paludibacter sp.]